MLFEPKADDKGKLKYSAAFLMPVGSPNIKLIEDAIALHVKNKNKGVKLPYGKYCLRNGEDKEFDGYGENVKFISASSKNRPMVVDLMGDDILQNAANAPYAGCYVNANVDVWFQDDKEFGKRINASLRSVMMLRDGEPFGAGPRSAKEEFGDVSQDAGENTSSSDDGDLN